MQDPEQHNVTRNSKRKGKIWNPFKSNPLVESMTETEGDGVSVQPVLYTPLEKRVSAEIINVFEVRDGRIFVGINAYSLEQKLKSKAYKTK